MHTPYRLPEVLPFYHVEESTHIESVPVDNKERNCYEYLENFYCEPPMRKEESYPSASQVYTIKEFESTWNNFTENNGNGDNQNSIQNAGQSLSSESRPEDQSITESISESHIQAESVDQEQAENMESQEEPVSIDGIGVSIGEELYGQSYTKEGPGSQSYTKEGPGSQSYTKEGPGSQSYTKEAEELKLEAKSKDHLNGMENRNILQSKETGAKSLNKEESDMDNEEVCIITVFVPELVVTWYFCQMLLKYVHV